jgi:hypothetical protein
MEIQKSRKKMKERREGIKDREGRKEMHKGVRR